MKSVTFLTVALCAGMSVAAAAQTPAPQEKVAVIAFQQAVTQTNEFQRSFADLQKKYTPRRDQLKALNDQINALKQQLQSSTLTAEQRASRAQTIQDKQKDLDRSAKEAQNDFQNDLKQDFSTVAGKVGQDLISYASRKGYTLVLDGSRPDAQLILWATPTTDITKALVDDYNVKSGIPAPPAPARSSAPQPSGAAHGAASPAHPSSAH